MKHVFVVSMQSAYFGTYSVTGVYHNIEKAEWSITDAKWEKENCADDPDYRWYREVDEDTGKEKAFYCIEKIEIQ